MNRPSRSTLRVSVLVVLLPLVSAARAQFTFDPPGQLVAGSGTGRIDARIYAPGIRFPIEVAPAYPNSQVWGVGGLYGPSGSQCSTINYTYPWRDNYCESRSWTMPLCPAGTGHQGQDIRPSTCANDTHWAVATTDGTITNVGSYSVYLTAADGTRYDYLHMRSVRVAVGDTVSRGERLGRVSDAFGTSSTTIHLHFNIRQVVAGYGSVYVPPYTSLIPAYESLLGTGGCSPAAEVCNGSDDDCDGTVDDGVTNACGACGELPPEVCDGRDNDCDGVVDEGSVCEVDELRLQPAAYDPGGTTDVDGDGRMDACARGPDGFRCWLASATGFVASDFHVAGFGDAEGFVDPTNYATIRMGDLDGDGLGDVCGRTDAGIDCYRSNGASFEGPIPGPMLDDAGAGFDATSRFSTIRMVDFDGDGDDDLCARTVDDFRCWPASEAGFGAPVTGPSWSDANGFTSPRYYGSIRMGDVTGDGKADVCVRGAVGIVCYLTEDTRYFTTRIVGPAWSDAAGWGQMPYWSTIRLADVDGDGRDDLCGRSTTDLRCHLSIGTGFATDPLVVASLSDSSGWNDHDNYSTLRAADVDGDGGEELCLRANEGIRCYRYGASGFSSFIGPDLSDAKGWDDPAYYRTLRLGDVSGDGRADLCARGAEGLFCWGSTGLGFGSELTLPTLSDSLGWDDPAYHTTLRVAGLGGVVPTDASLPDDGGAGVGTGRAGGCGCSLAGEASGSPGLPFATIVAALGLRVLRRRRSRGQEDA